MISNLPMLERHVCHRVYTLSGIGQLVHRFHDTKRRVSQLENSWSYHTMALLISCTQYRVVVFNRRTSFKYVAAVFASHCWNLSEMETLYSELAFRPNSYDPLEYVSYLNFDPRSSTLKALESGSNQRPVQTTLDSAKLAEWLGKVRH